MAILSIISAMAHRQVIGMDNTMPWHLPVDLQRFKALTTSKVILMGRSTYESIGRVLPNRTNVILSRQPREIDGAHCFTSLDAALHAFADEEEIMIIGGAHVYEQTIDKCDRLYLTFIDLKVNGDRFFPSFNKADWCIEHDHDKQVDADTGLGYRFIDYVRCT